MKAMIRTLTTVSFAVLLATPVLAGAQGRGGARGPRAGGRGQDRNQRWEQLLERVDANKDGKISKDEFAARHGVFDRLDTNKDGVISKSEIASAAKTRPRVQGMCTKMDANGDGEITLDESKAKRAAAFDRMDANHDGTIDKGEFMALKPGAASDGL